MLLRLLLSFAFILPLAFIPVDADSSEWQRPRLTTSDKPLVIIRFNQPKVYYERPLYQAVTQALQVNPNMTFDVVAFAPDTGEMMRNQEAIEQTQTQAQEVITALQGMGLKRENITYSWSASKRVSTPQTHIFIR